MARVTKPIPERRREIIDAARELFIESGFDGTQVSDISRKINVAQGLVYHYFKSKTAILYAVIDELAEERRRQTQESLSEAGGTALERLGILFGNQPGPDSLGKLIPSIANDSAVAEYCSSRMTASSMPLLITLIEQGNADGSWNCEYPMETAMFIMQGLSGFVKLSSSSTVEEGKKRALMRLVFRVLGSSSE